MKDSSLDVTNSLFRSNLIIVTPDSKSGKHRAAKRSESLVIVAPIGSLLCQTNQVLFNVVTETERLEKQRNDRNKSKKRIARENRQIRSRQNYKAPQWLMLLDSDTDYKTT